MHAEALLGSIESTQEALLRDLVKVAVIIGVRQGWFVNGKGEQRRYRLSDDVDPGFRILEHADYVEYTTIRSFVKNESGESFVNLSLAIAENFSAKAEEIAKKAKAADVAKRVLEVLEELRAKPGK